MLISPTKTINNVNENNLEDKIHPWRICPIGKHFVKKHIVHIPPSKEHPDGMTIERQEHCASNPSKKDILSFDEIQLITEKYFHKLNSSPLGTLKAFSNADKFDSEICGWVQYWNDIFSPQDLLDPKLVKALIASESSFQSKVDISAKKNGRARGLLQITDSTMHILSDHHGELSNYLIVFDHIKLFESSANICAGVRWLFRKKITASAKLGRSATWIEAVADYKGILEQSNPIAIGIKEKLQNYYLCLQEAC